MGYFATQHARVRSMIRVAFAEQATPPKVALALGLGVLVGTSPLLGFRAFIAVALASFTRLNRMLTFLGTNVSFGPLLGLFITAEVFLGSRLLGVPPPAFTLARAAQEATGALGAWWVGYAVVGPASALLAGLAGYTFARSKARAQAAWARSVEAAEAAEAAGAATSGQAARTAGEGARGDGPGVPSAAQE